MWVAWGYFELGEGEAWHWSFGGRWDGFWNFDMDWDSNCRRLRTTTAYGDVATWLACHAATTLHRQPSADHTGGTFTGCAWPRRFLRTAFLSIYGTGANTNKLLPNSQLPLPANGVLLSVSLSTCKLMSRKVLLMGQNRAQLTNHFHDPVTLIATGCPRI